VTREYRAECADAYEAQGTPDAPLERVTVAVEMRVCRKRLQTKVVAGYMAVDDYRAWADAQDRYRPRDEGNILDAIKAAIDALQPARVTGSTIIPGAGIVVGDDARHMTVGAPRLVEVETFAEEGVWITVDAPREIVI